MRQKKTKIQSTIHSNLVKICHKLYEKGLVSATDGNVSTRLPNGNIVATRSGISKDMVRVSDLVEVTPDGAKVRGVGRPSTELGMHLFIYKQRHDIHAVVHAHPPYATGFAAARIPLDRTVLPEVIVELGIVPLAEYATPSTHEVADSLAPYVKSYQAILLANHGVVTFGKDLVEAYHRMEKAEHAAHICFVARMIGGEHPLTPEEVGKLRAVSLKSYGKEVPKVV